MNSVVSNYVDNKSFNQNLLLGQSLEQILHRMFSQYYPDAQIIKWDFDTPEGKEMEQKGVDWTIILPSGFNLHIQGKGTFVKGLNQPEMPHNYVTLEWMKFVNTPFPKQGRFLKGETAHRWYFINKHNFDVIYFDYPKLQNYMINTIHKEYAGKFFHVIQQTEGKNLICRMDLDDELFDGRYQYLKYNNGRWDVIKKQWKHI
jgi:hypothetical protein